LPKWKCTVCPGNGDSSRSGQVLQKASMWRSWGSSMRHVVRLGVVCSAAGGSASSNADNPAFQLVAPRHDTLLGQAVLQRPPSSSAKAAADKCIRGGADSDLAPLRGRMEAVLGWQKARDCMRGAEQLYCETLLDVMDPWRLDRAPECERPPPERGTTSMEVERDVALCFVIFMVSETDAVQHLLAFRGPLDTAVVHVDTAQPEVAQVMAEWARQQTGVRVISMWKVLRPGYSAGAALLDALEVAAQEHRSWDAALFLSGSHFWMRPRSELSRFLFYHRHNFVAAQEDSQDVDRRLFVASHYELHFECGDRLWQVTRDSRDQSTVLLPRFGHPNLTAATGQPFTVLRRDFVEWLLENRRVRGSPAWTVLRYTMRLFANVEKMLASLLLTVAPWCHRTTATHDMTFAKVAAWEQKQQHNPTREGTESFAHSAGYLGLKDLTELRVARWHAPNTLKPPHGREEDGPPPKPPKPIGIYRKTSEAEQRAMDCDGCFQRMVMHNFSETAPVFLAFARKVEPALRLALASRDVLEPPVVWESMEWPLSARIWELWAHACPANGTVRAQRRTCDPRDEASPCMAEFRITAAAAEDRSSDGTCRCPSAVVLRERVAVGEGRIVAVQVGAGWESDSRTFAEPGLVSVRAKALEVAYFPALRRRYDVAVAQRVAVVLTPPPQDVDGEALASPVEDLRDIPKRAVVSFPLDDAVQTLTPGEWSVDLEVPANPPWSIAQRSFFVYCDAQEITRGLVLRYFDVSLDDCDG